MKRLFLLFGLLSVLATPNFAQTKTDTIQFDIKPTAGELSDWKLEFHFPDSIKAGIEIEWISYNERSNQRLKPGENGFNPDKEGIYSCLIPDSGQIRIYYSYKEFSFFSDQFSFYGFSLGYHIGYNKEMYSNIIPYIYVDYNIRFFLIDSLNISKCFALYSLYCDNNQLTNIDVNNDTALYFLSCSNNQLKNIDVNRNTYLWTLDCGNNQLTNLNLSQSHNNLLRNLSCSNNQLTDLNVRFNDLATLHCSGNKLTTLDVSHNTKLYSLSCANNQLTNLDISQNTALLNLDCTDNELTSLVISNNTYLSNLECANNHIPLNMLYKAYAQTDNWYTFKVDPQTDTFLIQRQQFWDLSSERVLGENVSSFEITDANGQTLSSDAYTEKDFTFRFLKNGQYKLTVQNRFDNEQVTFTWYVSVVDEIPEGSFTVLVATENAEWGTVAGNGTYQEGKNVTITALSKKGYRFVNWTKKDGSVFSTEAVHTFAVTENMELTAHFEQVPVANESQETDNLRIYAQDRTIYLSENRGLVQVFNTLGQCVYSGTATAIPVRTGGLYIVKVGAHSHKVLVR